MERKVISLTFALLAGSLILSLAVSSTIFGTLCFLTLILVVKNRKQGSFTKLDFLFLSFFTINILSLLWTEDLNRGLNEITNKWAFLVLPLLYFGIKKIKVNYELIFKAFIISVILFGLILTFSSVVNILGEDRSLIEFFTKNVRFKLVKISPISFHPPYLALFLNLCLIILLHLKWQKKIETKFLIPIIIFICTLLYINSSMMGFACFFVITVVYLIFTLSKKLIKYIFVFLVLFSSIFSLVFNEEISEALKFDLDPKVDYWETPKYRILRFFDEGDPTRKENWNISREIIQTNTLFGTGVGDFVNELQKRRNKDQYAYKNRLNSHNQYISVLGKIGILGGIIFLGILAFNFIVAINNKSFLLMGFNIIFVLSFFTENILDRQWGYLLFCFFNYFIYDYITGSKIQIQKP
ncbi:MAG: O-antigen ligase family protein [bacterium]